MTVSVQSLPAPGPSPVAVPPRWTFLIADLRGGQILAELPCDNASFNLPLNDAGRFGASLTMDDRIASKYNVGDLTCPARRTWYALRDGRPMYGGIIWTSSYDSSSQKVSIAGADFWSYFDRRKIISTAVGNLPDDPTWISRLVFRLDDVDQNSVVRALVSSAQGHIGGHIGIQYDDTFSGILRDRTWYGYDLSDVGDAVRKLCDVLDGPDVRFVVVADPAAPGGIRRRLMIGEPQLGQSGSPHVWEYGRNLHSYNWPRDGSGMATRSYATGDGMAEGMPIALHQDSALYDQGWPALELETSYSTVRDYSTLREHAEADQVAARAPIVLPTLALRPGIGPHLGEYNPGDDARLIIKDRYWPGGLDTLIRLNDIRVSYSASTGELVTLVCAPLAEGVI